MSILISPMILIIISIIVLCAIFVIKPCLKKHPAILLGSYQLLQSPSGVFGLITLAAITVVTLYQPSVGGTAFTAFATIVPAILSWTEHREELVKMANNTPSNQIIIPPDPPPPPNPAKPTVDESTA